jgi:hypothetical protein
MLSLFPACFLLAKKASQPACGTSEVVYMLNERNRGELVIGDGRGQLLACGKVGGVTHGEKCTLNKPVSGLPSKDVGKDSRNDLLEKNMPERNDRVTALKCHSCSVAGTRRYSSQSPRIDEVRHFKKNLGLLD